MKQKYTKYVFILFLLVGLRCQILQANQMQSFIANAGINLGCLSSWIERFGVTPENSAMINGWINTVNTDLNNIIALYRAPFKADGIRKIAQSLMRFNITTARWNNSQRGGFFHNIYSQLKQQFSLIFDSRRGGLSYSATCDSFILDFGYHYGRAWIGAWVADGYLLSSARGGMNLAISSGLRCAQNLGCSFPYQEMWNGLNLRSLNTNQAYRDAFGQVINIISSFRGLPSPGFVIPSTPQQPGSPPPPSGGSLEGKWRSGATRDIIRFERQGNIFRGYMAELVGSRLSRVGDQMGEFTQTGNNSYSGKIKRINPDGSISWLDGVSIQVNGNTAQAVAPWWSVPITYTRVN